MSAILYRLQLSSASVSLLFSSFIAGRIVRSDGGLTSPYRRIIFGLSISDIIQSLSIIAGPFAVPSSSPLGAWAIGNYHTCQVDGFLLSFAGLSTPMYFFGLCFYTTLKIKRNMTDEAFSRRIEKVMHILIIALSFGVACFGIVTKTINPSVIGSVCTFAAMPTGCRQRPDLFGECDSVIRSNVAIIIYISTSISLLCLLGIICCMGNICWYGIRRSKILRIISTSRKRLRAGSASLENVARRVEEKSSILICGADIKKATIEDDCSLSNVISGEENDTNHMYKYKMTEKNFAENQGTTLSLLSSSEEEKKSDDLLDPNLHHKDEKESIRKHQDNQDTQLKDSIQEQLKNSAMLTRLYQREIIFQAFSFFLAYFITFIFWWVVEIILLAEKSVPVALLRAVHVCYPLGGFFNVLAYARPKVSSLRIRNPEYSLLQAFWCVIKAGGDAPRLDEPLVSHYDASSDNQRSTVGAFGGCQYAHTSSFADCLYNGSQFFGSENTAHKNHEKWSYGKDHNVSVVL